MNHEFDGIFDATDDNTEFLSCSFIPDPPIDVRLQLHPVHAQPSDEIARLAGYAVDLAYFLCIRDGL